MRRFSDTQQPPQRQMNPETVTEPFKVTWWKPTEDFIETEKRSILDLEGRITQAEEVEMRSLMVDETNIAKVIKSCDDFSACEVDRISSRLVKAAGTEGVTCRKLFGREQIQSGRVISTWKEAETIMLHKKRDWEEIGT
jgi:hypothetical protein